MREQLVARPSRRRSGRSSARRRRPTELPAVHARDAAPEGARRLRVQRRAGAREAPAPAAARDRRAPGRAPDGRARGLVARAEVAGPGFVNLWLAHVALAGAPRERPRASPTRSGGATSSAGSASRSSSSRRIRPGRSASATAARRSSATASRGSSTRSAARSRASTTSTTAGARCASLGASVKARYLELLGRAAPPPEDALRDDGAALARGDRRAARSSFPRDGYRGEYIREIAARAPRRARRRRSSTSRADGRFRSRGRAHGLRGDPRHDRRARHPLRRVLQRDVALRGGQARGDARRTCARRTSSTRRTGAVWLRATQLGLDRDRVLVKRTRRADLPAARRRLPPREVPRAASSS